jgi:hypothetical protein
LKEIKKMAFPVLETVAQLADFDHVIHQWLCMGCNDDHKMLEEIVEIAEEVTGTLDPTDIIQRLKDNEEMMSAFHKAIVHLGTETGWPIIPGYYPLQERCPVTWRLLE